MFHMEQLVCNEWFKNWFNSKYYHILYKNRDFSEAEFFISNFIEKVNIKPNSLIWDNACGNGRHAYIFAKKGFNVIGTDICDSNIQFAQSNFQLPNLNFFIHDMRREFYLNYFDLAINIFTSIGYFDYVYEEEKAIKVMSNSLKKSGLILIDFLNANYLNKNLVPRETKLVDDIVFEIKREIKKGFVYKHIQVIDGNNKFNYLERVRLLTKSFFEREFDRNKIGIISTWGDYSLNDFDIEISERLILLGVKK
ncbi:MAG: class I SAM-dependent methyltransferase [Bacteroidia bacterium]|nr:class I SAM-dependent methyltransferase [Bacteroidia bacterium]